MKPIALQFREIIDKAKPQFLQIPEARASAKPLPEKWSLKEIVGHMLDSAANNLQRFVRMQQSADIGKFSYDQEHWVASQHYQEESWQALVELWHSYNAHLAHVIEHVDPKTLGHICDMGYAKPATLKFVIEDYVRHIQHHIDQILSNADPAARKKWVPRVPE